MESSSGPNSVPNPVFPASNMPEILLKELSKQDVTWLLSLGQCERLEMGTILLQPQSSLQDLYIILEGELSATTGTGDRGLGEVYAALEGKAALEEEIGRLAPGEILGEWSLLEQPAIPLTVTASQPTTVLRIALLQLEEKLETDSEFSAHFHKTIALLSLNRIERLTQTLIRRKRLKIQPLQDGALLFSSLRDSDIDWLSQQGHLQQVAPQQILIASGQRVKSCYILLQGILSLSVIPSQPNTLNRVFAALETPNPTVESVFEIELVQLRVGEIAGETAILDDRLSSFTIKALDAASVLAIPRDVMLTKLQHDRGFSSRYYRAVAILQLSRLQGLIDRLGYGRGRYQIGGSLSELHHYEDELDMKTLDQLSLGGARLAWMLKRLQLRAIES